jgi:PAS domain S-box-containing protein
MKPISIYIVEDELLISASLKSQLQQFGYEISGSSTRGESCLEEITSLSEQGREPEIVLMDIHLRGELDGIETARRINDKFNCAIIFLTGQSSKEVYERSFKIKPFGYLLKPIDMEQTKMTIEIASYQRNLEIENTLYQKNLEALLEKRSQENREMVAMYQTIIDNSQMGFTIRQEDRFVFANSRVAELFGYSLDEFLALYPRQIEEMTHPEDLQAVYQLFKPAINGEDVSRRARFRIETKELSIRHVESHVKVVQFKGKQAFHQTFLDISHLFPEVLPG